MGLCSSQSEKVTITSQTNVMQTKTIAANTDFAKSSPCQINEEIEADIEQPPPNYNELIPIYNQPVINHPYDQNYNQPFVQPIMQPIVQPIMQPIVQPI